MRSLFVLAIVASSAAHALDFEKYIATTCYIFDLQRTPAIERTLRDSLVKPGEDRRRNVESVMKLHDDLAQMPATQRQAVRELVRFKALGEQRKKAAQGDAEAAWLVGEFDRQHPAITMSDPPLTRETAAAYFEMLRYVASPLASGGKDAVIAKIASEYPAMQAAVREQVQMVPVIMAVVRHYAPSMSPDQLASLRQGIRMRYCPTPEDIAMMRQMQAGMANVQQRMIQQSWNAFMGNMENIYGSSRWNPNTGRYDVNPGMRTTIP
jgi:hypothetical protein